MFIINKKLSENFIFQTVFIISCVSGYFCKLKLKSASAGGVHCPPVQAMNSTYPTNFAVGFVNFTLWMKVAVFSKYFRSISKASLCSVLAFVWLL